jgi:hypothetical protein
MNVFLAIGQFFAKIGPYVGTALGIASHVIGEEHMAMAINLARDAAERFAGTQLDARREFVIAGLMQIPGMSESVARLLVEFAVQHLKAEASGRLADLAKKVEDAAHVEASAAPENDPPAGP